jgi:protein-tyrosine-phosphatase
VTRDLLERADLVIVMDESQERRLARVGVHRDRIVYAGDLDPIWADSRAIRDPWRQDFPVFEASYTRLERCARVLIPILRRQVTPTPAPLEQPRPPHA